MEFISFFGKGYECNKTYEIFRKDTPYGTISISAEFYYDEKGNQAATVYFHFNPYGLNYDCTCYVHKEYEGKYSGKYVASYKNYDITNTILIRYYGKVDEIRMDKYDRIKCEGQSLFEFSVDKITDRFMLASEYSLNKIYSYGDFDLMKADTANGKPMKGESTHYSLYDGTIEFFIARNHFTEDDIDIIANLNGGRTCSGRMAIIYDKKRYFYSIINYPSGSVKRANKNGVFPSNVTTEEDAIICAEYLMSDLIFHSLKSSLATVEKQYKKLKKSYDSISKYMNNNEEAKNEKR